MTCAPLEEDARYIFTHWGNGKGGVGGLVVVVSFMGPLHLKHSAQRFPTSPQPFAVDA